MHCLVFDAFFAGCGHILGVNECHNCQRLGSPTLEQMEQGCDPTVCTIESEALHIEDDSVCPSCTMGLIEPFTGDALSYAMMRFGRFTPEMILEHFNLQMPEDAERVEAIVPEEDARRAEEEETFQRRLVILADNRDELDAQVAPT